MVAAACLWSSHGFATDLHGRVEAKRAQPVEVEIRSSKPPHQPVRKVITDREGRFYLPDIPPGRYELVVNGTRFPISVEQVAIQEVPPIQLKS